MLALPRRYRDRLSIRLQLAEFLLKHATNRALIACMYMLGEVSSHLGLFELEAAGSSLFVDNGGGADDPSHGDGAAPPSGPPAVRSVGTEEIFAVKWKCGLHKASDEHACAILGALPA